MKKLHLGLGAITLLFGACAEAPNSDDFGHNGTGVQFKIAPLTLDSLVDACYSFAVINEGNELVVGRGPGVANSGALNSTLTGSARQTICASQFGNGAGGDVSYVAPCDADADNNGDTFAQHRVVLWVDALCATPVTDKLAAANWSSPSPNNQSGICNEMQPYQNPCGKSGCSLDVICVENADTPVVFNLTVMGQADQGFFDIAVNFSDIFCSAKLDTCYAAGEAGPADDTPINLLFADGVRTPTAVLALACTAGGDSTTGTMLHLGNVVVTCTDPATVTTLLLGSVTVEGNQNHTGNQATTPPLADGDAGLIWSAWFGSEQLGQGGTSWNKEYFNIGITNLGPNCSVTWAATATDGQPMPGVDALDATYTTYPVVKYGPLQVTGPLAGTPEAPTWLCSQNPINRPDSEVVTDNVSCTDPGGCLEGPCISTQGGAFIDCAAGSSPVPKACGEMPQIEQAFPAADACPKPATPPGDLASTVDTHLNTHLTGANAQLGFLDRSLVMDELERALGLLNTCDLVVDPNCTPCDPSEDPGCQPCGQVPDPNCEQLNGIDFASFEQGGTDLAVDLASWLTAPLSTQHIACGTSFTVDTERFCEEAIDPEPRPECIWDGVPLVVTAWSPEPGHVYLNVLVGPAQHNPFDILVTPGKLAIVIDFAALRQSLLLLDLPAPDVFTGKGELVITDLDTDGYSMTLAVRDNVVFQVETSEGEEESPTERYRISMPDACPLLSLTADRADNRENGTLTTNFSVPTVTAIMPLSAFDDGCADPDPAGCVTSTTEVVLDFAGLGGELELSVDMLVEVLTATDLNAGGRPSTVKASTSGLPTLISLDSNAAESDGNVSFEVTVTPSESGGEPTWRITEIAPFWRLDAIFGFSAVAGQLNNVAPSALNDVASIDVQPAASLAPELEFVGGATPTWKVIAGSFTLESTHLGQTLLVIAGQCLVYVPAVPPVSDPHPFDEYSVVTCP